jgi:heme-degrading monooxygenase HmoA
MQRCELRFYESVPEDVRTNWLSGWRGWISTDRAAAYVEYVTRTGLSSYKKTPGNLGAQIWTRDLGDGRTEIMTVSWWSSRIDIEAFAGRDIGVAVFYPEDDDYLIDRETTVTHYEVAETPLSPAISLAVPR